MDSQKPDSIMPGLAFSRIVSKYSLEYTILAYYLAFANKNRLFRTNIMHCKSLLRNTGGEYPPPGEGPRDAQCERCGAWGAFLSLAAHSVLICCLTPAMKPLLATKKASPERIGVMRRC